MTVPVTSEFVEKMMEEFKEQRKIHKKYVKSSKYLWQRLTLVRFVYQIGIEAKKLLQQQPTLVEITIPEDAKMTVCGDVHGQFYDLLNIFKLNGLPSEKNMYLFNGDFVDRGIVSVIATVMCWISTIHIYRKLLSGSVVDTLSVEVMLSQSLLFGPR